MTSENIVVVALKRTVLAFDRQTGARLWTKSLSSALTGDFVTLIADTSRVYAHTHGEIYCLDLFTGAILWRDGLAGLGFGIASIALPGQSATTLTPAAKVRQQQEQAAAAAAAS